MKKIPDGWEAYSVGEVILDIADGGTPARKNPLFFGGNIPWVVIEDIKPFIRNTKNTLSELGLNSSSAKLWPSGTVILSTGATLGEVGIAELPVTTKQGICGVVCNPKHILNRYLYYFFLSKKNYINSLAQGSSIREFRPPQVRKMFILLPPLPEQEKIAEILGSVDAAIDATRRVIEQTRTLKRALMQQLLTRGIPGRHKRFKPSPLGEIPEEWEVTTIGAVGDWHSGGTPSKSNEAYWNGNIMWVCPRDMKQTHIEKTEYLITAEGANDGSRIVPSGSLFIVVRGMILAHTLPVSIATVDCAFNQDVKALQVSNLFDNEFVRLWIQNNSKRLLYLVDESTHGTKRLQTGALFNFPIYKPSLGEQEDIAELLLSFETRIDIEIKGIAFLSNLKTALMQALLTGDTRIPAKALKRKEAV